MTIDLLGKALDQRLWRLANQVTADLALQIRTNQAVLLSVDAMWIKSSGRRFGFSTQSAIWATTQANSERARRDRFGIEVGWRSGVFWKCWDDSPEWATKAFVPKVSSAPCDAESHPVGLLPFHDVLSSGDWSREFSARDCWGEEHWRTLCDVWARI